MGDATAADVELAEVDAAADAGHFARFGEPRPEYRGEHAGVDLGTRVQSA